MKFILGFLSGLVLGALGAVLYSVSTGRDLRDEYAGVREELVARDFDALGNRLESRFTELQANLQDRITQIQSQIPGAASNGNGHDALDVAADVVDGAGDAAANAIDDASEAVEDAAKG